MDLHYIAPRVFRCAPTAHAVQRFAERILHIADRRTARDLLADWATRGRVILTDGEQKVFQVVELFRGEYTEVFLVCKPAACGGNHYDIVTCLDRLCAEQLPWWPREWERTSIWTLCASA